MVCRRCPHYVRHGQVADDKKTFIFKDRCSLKMRNTSGGTDHTCQNYPFQMGFNYIECETYQKIFKGASQRNDVVPLTDIQFSDSVSNSSITEMELL